MKVISISARHRNLPLKQPYWLSGGRLRFEKLDATFVRLETDRGIED